MDANIVLDVFDEAPQPPAVGAGVSGHNVIQATLPDGRTLIVMAGTAVPEYRVDDTDNVHTCSCIVKLPRARRLDGAVNCACRPREHR